MEIWRGFERIFPIRSIIESATEKVMTSIKDDLDRAREEVEDLVKKEIAPRARRVVQIFEYFDLVCHQALLEQSIVTAATAFEVYTKDIISLINLNPKVAYRFTEKIDKKLRFRKYKDRIFDRGILGEVVVSDKDFYDVRKVKSLFRRAINIDNAFQNSRFQSRMKKPLSVAPFDCSPRMCRGLRFQEKEHSQWKDRRKEDS